uniref:NADH dehydrogenase subunit 4L n=1 Tax=Megalophaedusa expansilabris TaxID=1885698 RepID=A0A224ABI6_9EUPU|nr:NADH dehydrogenase subunit 4L [Megalophaedusa expansilabris]
MMMKILFFSLLMLLLGVFFSTIKQFLLAMLVLKSIVLTSLMFILFILSMYESSFMVFILLLTLGVCEAGLGLSLLMSLIKVSGSAEIRSTMNNVF